MLRWYARIISKHWCCWACERKSPVWWESNCVHCPLFESSGNIDEVDRKETCVLTISYPEWNLFDNTMKESRRLDTIEMLRVHTNVRTLSEWFRINYLSKVSDNTIRKTSSEWSRLSYLCKVFDNTIRITSSELLRINNLPKVFDNTICMRHHLNFRERQHARYTI